jgi:hypothetical protein
MPLSFSAEEMELLLSLAQPIDQRQRDQFLREATVAIEEEAARTGIGPVLAWCIGSRAGLNGAFSFRPNCPTRRRASATRVDEKPALEDLGIDKNRAKGRGRRGAEPAGRSFAAIGAFGFVQCSPRSPPTRGEKFMATVFIEARPKGRREGTAIVDYVVEEQGDRFLKAFKTQAEAITWAKSEGHSPHVARVRHLNDKKIPDHWRPV